MRLNKGILMSNDKKRIDVYKLNPSTSRVTVVFFLLYRLTYYYLDVIPTVGSLDLLFYVLLFFSLCF